MRLRAFLLMSISVACGPTAPKDAPHVAYLSMTPADTGIVKGATVNLALSAKDLDGKELRVTASWTSSDASVATVNNAGVVTAVGIGTAFIGATVGTSRTGTSIVVTEAPVQRRYSVLDLGVSLPVGGVDRMLSDSGEVLSFTPAVLYHDGTPVALTGCPYPVTLNGPGHVLCMLSRRDSVSSYALWRNGSLMPLAASDTFKAQSFRALALNDSDEVAGMFYLPTFVNAGCASTSTRCLSIWKSGAATFIGSVSPPSSLATYVTLLNTLRQAVIDFPGADSDVLPTAYMYDVRLATYRDTPTGARALNDNGWAAIRFEYVAHGAPSGRGSRAYVQTPQAIIDLGEGAASGINDSNVVVGTLKFGPFIWRGSGVALLTAASVDPAWTITSADEINNRGQILARANNADGRKDRAIVLNPVQP